MMLITALAVWLVLLLLFVALCRMAAYKDGRGSASPQSHAEPFTVARTVAAGLVIWEDQPARGELSDLRLRVPLAR
jgi:hypothetical protein